MATTTITPDQDAVVAEVHIAAPPERVFQALTDPGQLLQWWGQHGMYRCTDWRADVRPGGAWQSDGVSDNDGAPFHVTGEYLEVDPPHRLVYTWSSSWCSHLKTIVHIDLEPVRGGTMLRLRHSGFASEPAQAQNHNQGWQRVLGLMREFVEKGETVATRAAA